MAAGRVPHPYYPLDLVLDNYVPNSNSMKETLTILFSAFGVIAIGALALAHGKRNSTLKGFSNQSTFLWFTMCGFIHFFLEGYFGINHATLAGDQTTFGQVWKEYALSDSRYLSNDSFILIMENITAVSFFLKKKRKEKASKIKNGVHAHRTFFFVCKKQNTSSLGVPCRSSPPGPCTTTSPLATLPN